MRTPRVQQRVSVLQPLAECCARPLMNIHVASVVGAECCNIPQLNTEPRWWWVVALGKGPTSARRTKRAKHRSLKYVRSGELATGRTSRPPCEFCRGALTHSIMNSSPNDCQAYCKLAMPHNCQPLQLMLRNIAKQRTNTAGRDSERTYIIITSHPSNTHPFSRGCPTVVARSAHRCEIINQR